MAGKATRLTFGKAKIATLSLQLIHSGICGSINIRAQHGAHYFITFIYDFTIYGHVYFISHISESLERFKRYNRLVENQLNVNIKSLWTDRGHKYIFNLF